MSEEARSFFCLSSGGLIVESLPAVAAVPVRFDMVLSIADVVDQLQQAWAVVRAQQIYTVEG